VGVSARQTCHMVGPSPIQSCRGERSTGHSCSILSIPGQEDFPKAVRDDVRVGGRHKTHAKVRHQWRSSFRCFSAPWVFLPLWTFKTVASGNRATMTKLYLPWRSDLGGGLRFPFVLRSSKIARVMDSPEERPAGPKLVTKGPRIHQF
jgi:hypothetical protein